MKYNIDFPTIYHGVNHMHAAENGYPVKTVTMQWYIN